MILKVSVDSLSENHSNIFTEFEHPEILGKFECTWKDSHGSTCVPRYLMLSSCSTCSPLSIKADVLSLALGSGREIPYCPCHQ